MPFNIALFASGSGSNVENIVRYFSDKPDFHFPVIISNKSDAFVHQRAKTLHIPSFTFTKDDFFDGHKILTLLKEYQVDFIVLAGFLLKIPPTIISAFPDKIINIHPALLPKFGGKGMYGHHVHHAVIEAGETQSGITIHYVNEHYDEGNIIFQAVCEVLPEDTPDTLANKVHALEYEYFPLIIEKIATTRK
ncbi:MAG: Phosphoribosylglycinamide formyltransferase [Bacteroidetes bacterium ADurb.Bin174]|jgi:phosphoribosylglycinamide formyltransferase-1|nr:MAG: Phosphoribosylglycinamide formyltransferase [Bacteroidetes bacterium ADurb.Bin174]